MRRMVLAGVAIAALGTGPAHGYSNLFAFGDSLTDGGNAYYYTSSMNALPPLNWPPTPPGLQRFSNGLTAAELLAPMLGLPAIQRSSLPGGTNYAVGGATTDTRNYNYEINYPAGLPSTLQNTGMLSQYTLYKQFFDSAHPNVSDALFFLWGGPNDIFLGAATGGSNGAALAAATAVTNLASLVQGLAINGGARHFVVLNMPDLGSTPGGTASGNAAGLTFLSGEFNKGLAIAMGQVEAALPAIDITVFDTFALLANVTANPGAFGISNVTSPCLGSLAAISAGCKTPDGKAYLYFDEVHPTTFTNAILANAVYAQLVPEPGTWAMLAAGLLVLAFAVRRRIA